MRHTVLPNGNLMLTASNTDRSALAEAYRLRGYYGAEMLISEAFHELLTFIQPEHIGALTDAPILTDDADYSDEAMARGGPVPHDDVAVWWFPDYMVIDPWAELTRKGRVVFTKA
jgi:hypothetical protein